MLFRSVSQSRYGGIKFQKLEDALKSYSKEELLDIFLQYEGIIGFTSRIINVMQRLGFIQGEDDSKTEASLKEAQSFRHLPAEKFGSYATRVYDLGLQFEKDCPNNDCRLYRNTFRMCREADEQISLLHGWARTVLEGEVTRRYIELEGMYLMNYAVKQYRRQHEAQAGRNAS